GVGVALDDVGVHVGVAADQFPARQRVAADFDFATTDAGLADRQVVGAGEVVLVTRRAVLVGQLEQREPGVERAAEVAALDTHLVLLALARVDDIAGDVDIGLRLEHLGIAGIQRVPLVQVEDQATIGRDLGVFPYVA